MASLSSTIGKGLVLRGSLVSGEQIFISLMVCTTEQTLEILIDKQFFFPSLSNNSLIAIVEVCLQF